MSAHQIFPKFYVLAGIQKEVTETFFSSFRANLNILKEPLLKFDRGVFCYLVLVLLKLVSAIFYQNFISH